MNVRESAIKKAHTHDWHTEKKTHSLNQIKLPIRNTHDINEDEARLKLKIGF